MQAQSTARRLAPLAILAAVLVAAIVLVAGGGGDDGRRLVIDADDARFVIEGAEVRVAGQIVGEVTSAEPTREGRARVEVRIDDDDVWPVPDGTRARFRWGSTIAYTNRRVDLVLPRKGGKPLPAGATIAADRVTTSVEVDEVLGLFDARGRKDLERFIDESGPALDAAKGELRRAVRSAPPALAEVNKVLEDLGGDEEALDTLLEQTDQVVHAVQRANPGIGRLLSGAAGTMEAVGGRARALQATLERLPGALGRTRSTLAHADATLLSANDLARRLDPGIDELRRITAPLNGTLAAVQGVGPDARRTLATLRRAAPDLDAVLGEATALMPRLERVGAEGHEAVRCIRPFAPEIAGFLTTWTSMTSVGDGRDAYMRGNFIAYPFGLTWPQGSADMLKAFPMVDYAFPRPPGQSSGQPWFQPQCNLGPETLDPSKDPEAP